MKQIKKSIAVLLLLWSTAQTAFADTANEYLVVHLANGSQVSYMLEEKPVVTYDGPVIRVESAAVSDDHRMSEVEKLTFVKKADVSEQLAADEIRIVVAPESVTVQGLPAGTSLTLADLQGRVLATAAAGATGEATKATGSLPGGVYIVAAANGHVFKIYK